MPSSILNENEQSLKVNLEPHCDGAAIKLNGDTIVTTELPPNLTRDSCKVKSNNIVQYGWESKPYYGNLIDVHKDGKLLAYALHGSSGSLVRIYDRVSQSRLLLKGFNGCVVDVAWAFCSSPLVLAAVDEGGSIHIYEVTHHRNADEQFTHKRFLLLERKSSKPIQVPFRIHWCPFVPEDADSEDHSLMLVVTHNNEVELLHVPEMVEEYGDTVNVDAFCANDNPRCYLKHVDKTDVTSITISPDGTAVSLGLKTGEVIFYVIEPENTVRAAHTWVPHGGKPVTSLVFLDNLKCVNTEQFWKYAITAAEGNREIKLWSCESCIEAPQALATSAWDLRLSVDLSGHFIFLSDVTRRCMYAIEIQSTDAAVKMSLSEFPIMLPALCFSIVSCNHKRFRPFSPLNDNEADGVRTEDEDDTKVVGVHAILAAINHRHLCELEIRFQPQLSGATIANESFSSISTGRESNYRDALSDLAEDSGKSKEIATAMATVEEYDSNPQNQLFGYRSSQTIDSSPTMGSKTPTTDHSGSNGKWNALPSCASDLNTHVNGLRQTSASPSSEEVSSILAHSINHLNNIEPSMAQLPATTSVYSSLAPVSVENQQLVIPVTEAAIAASVVRQASLTSVSDKYSPSAANIPDAHFSASISKLSIAVDRVVNHLQRQENELTQLKALLVPHVDDVKSVHAAVTSLTEHSTESRDVYDKLLKGALENASSYNVRPDELQSLVQTTVERGIKNAVSDDVRVHIHNIVFSSLNDNLKQMRDMLQLEVAQKLTATDNLLKDNISKSFRSKQMLDAISHAVGQVILKDVHAAFKETFQKNVIPSFETATRQLLSQINETFVKGCKEYAQQLKAQSTELKQCEIELQKTIDDKLSSVTTQLCASFDRQMNSVMSTVQSQMETQIQVLRDAVRNAVREEVSSAIREQQATIQDSVARALRSTAPTPVPRPASAFDLQQTLKKLLQQNQINEAFNMALSAGDEQLSSVMFLCSKLNPEGLFNGPQPCPLAQNVVLSLVHQLSNDLAHNTELKLKYLQEAIMVLDKNNALVREHIATVIGSMQRKIVAYIQGNPLSTHIRTLKMIQMASTALTQSQ